MAVNGRNCIFFVCWIYTVCIFRMCVIGKIELEDFVGRRSKRLGSKLSREMLAAIFIQIIKQRGVISMSV
jgi:hypothetical protein